MLRNRILMVSLIIVSAVLVGFYGGTMSYLFFYTSLFIPITSFLYVIWVFSKFRVYQEIGSKIVVKEEQVPYLFKLTNEDVISYTKVNVTFLKKYCSVGEIDSLTDYCLVPGESVDIQSTMQCHYRGNYKVGIESVVVSDYFRLFRIKYKIPTILNVEVLPRVLPLDELAIVPEVLDLKKEPESFPRNPYIPDVEIRNYQSGDSPRVIHWKASARQNTLLSRKFTDEPKTEIVLLLDLSKIEATDFEKTVLEDQIVEGALAIANYFYNKNTPLMILFDRDGINKFWIHSRNDFDQFYQLCCNVAFRSLILPHELLKTSLSSINSNQYGILLTTKMTDELYLQSYEYVNLENRMSILLFDEKKDDTIREKLDQRIYLYQISATDCVADVLKFGESK